MAPRALAICELGTSTLVTLRTSDFASASENVSRSIAVDGMATRHPNQMLLSAAPPRIVPRLEPLGRWEIEGTGGLACCVDATTVPSASRRRPRRPAWMLFFMSLLPFSIGMLPDRPPASLTVPAGGNKSVPVTREE